MAELKKFTDTIHSIKQVVRIRKKGTQYQYHDGLNWYELTLPQAFEFIVELIKEKQLEK